MSDLLLITFFCLGYALTLILYLGIVSGILKRRWHTLSVPIPRDPYKKL